MNRVHVVSVLISMAVGLLAGCQNSASIVTSSPHGPWTHLRARNRSDTLRFVIMSDRTGGHRPGVFSSAVEKVNLLQPEFVICVGDLIEGYTVGVETLTAEHDEIDAIVARLEAPFFYVAGNHDITNDVMARLYCERYGRPYYHFTYKNVLFIVLCTEDPP